MYLCQTLPQRGVAGRCWGGGSPEFGGATVAVVLAREHMLLKAGKWGRKWLRPRNLLGDKMSQ